MIKSRKPLKVKKIRPNQIVRAHNLYDFYNLQHSITKGRSQIYGAIGEIMVMDEYGCGPQNTYDYDMIIDGYKVDVKTKVTNYAPKPHYNCTVFDYNTTQQCDRYYFVRVLKDMTIAYLLGYIDKSDFYARATFGGKGEPDEQYNFMADCWNIKVSDLRY